MRGRPCKYGTRGENGKCPPKPKTKKIRGRPCKYGTRGENGKCPSKPKTKKIRGRPCKHGPRKDNGKCPRNPNKTKKAIKVKTPSPVPEPVMKENTPSPVPEPVKNMDNEEIEVLLYENGRLRTFDNFSYTELETIEQSVSSMLKVNEHDIKYEGNDDEQMIVHKVKNINGMVGNGSKKYPVNQKIMLQSSQHYLGKTGTIELVFNTV